MFTITSSIRSRVFSRTIFTFSRAANNSSKHSAATSHDHTTDSYTKDVDSSPPPDSSIHRVDPDSSHTVQRPHEPPSGEWSRAGANTEEYAHAEKGSEEQPYTPAGGEHQRYGGKETYANEKKNETSHPGDGPEGKQAGGRRPERQ